MTELSREGNGQAVGMSRPEFTSRDGRPPAPPAEQARYCAFCGAEVGQQDTPARFGEAFCSEAHAEEFAKGVRAARVQAAAAKVPRADAATPEQAAGGAAKPWDFKRALKMVACCGAPLLALVVLAGGGGALLGAAGAILPMLLVLACPLGMFWMMRSMAKMDHDKDKGAGDGK